MLILSLGQGSLVLLEKWPQGGEPMLDLLWKQKRGRSDVSLIISSRMSTIPVWKLPTWPGSSLLSTASLELLVRLEESVPLSFSEVTVVVWILLVIYS
jgi:hypothetical protein